MKCVSCAHPLRQLASVLAVRSWICDACKSVAADVATLAVTVPRERLAAIHEVMRDGPDGHRGCPRCALVMQTGSVRGGWCTVEVDACRTCRIAWFDKGELTKIRTTLTAEGPPAISSLTPSERSMWRLEQLREEARVDDEETTATILGLFLRIPMPEPVLGLVRPAFTTWGIAAVTCATSIAAFLSGVDVAARRFGLIPDELSFTHSSGLLTHFFVHADVFHLLGNMAYFVVFGSRVEELIGPLRVVSVLFLATIVGALAHVAGAPDASIPLIGASGGISGVLAAYVCLRPHSKVRWLVWYQLVRVPAWAFFLLWIGLQIIGVAMQIAGASPVSALGHVGGAATGFLIAFAWKKRAAERDAQYGSS